MKLALVYGLATTILVACGDGHDGAAAPELANESAALAADRDLLAALAANDRAAADALIDAQFEWIDVDGRVWDRDAALAGATDLADDLSSEDPPGTFHYGHVEVITSARPGQRAMRVWALQPAGWKVVAVISTALETGATPFAAVAPSAGGEDCENPCRSMPYTPTTDTEQTLADLFMQLKMDEWQPNAERWAPYVLDGVDYTTATAQLSKTARVEHLRALERTGAPSLPGDPVVSMRIADFGDAAVMFARHTPYRGGQPYLSVRVWAFRDGRWQLANTQQTAIVDAPPAAPI